MSSLYLKAKAQRLMRQIDDQISGVLAPKTTINTGTVLTEHSVSVNGQTYDVDLSKSNVPVGSQIALTNIGRLASAEYVAAHEGGAVIGTGVSTPAVNTPTTMPNVSTGTFRYNGPGGNFLSWDSTSFTFRSANSNLNGSGELVVTAGSVGGWGINPTYLAMDTGSASDSAGMAPDDYPFYAGATYANRATAPFRVSPSGFITACNAMISGSVIAGSATLSASGIRLNAIAGKFSGGAIEWWTNSPIYRELSIGTEVDLAGVVGTYQYSRTDYKMSGDNSITINAGTYLALKSAASDTIGIMGGRLDVYAPISASGLISGSGGLNVDSDINFSKGINVGNLLSAVGTGDVGYSGDLRSFKNSTNYNVYGTVQLVTSLSSANWNDTAKTLGDCGVIDLSSVFGVPAGIKAAHVRMSAQDETVGVNFRLGSASAVNKMFISQYTQVANQPIEISGRCNCDTNGDIYFSTTGELDSVYLYITAYDI
jgi:hypothetical protein